MEVNRQSVSRGQIECLWHSVADRMIDPQAGIFGPSSVSWKVGRESGLFLGAGRAALLQLAHPWVATALDQHSNLRNDPLARFHNTFRVVFTMLFGTLDQAMAAARHVFQLHTRVQGVLTESISAYSQGSRYRANEVNALLWVFSTLIDSALVAYESVLPALSIEEREAYYSESKTLAALFGIASAELPEDWSQFEAYNRSVLNSDLLGVNALSRELSHRILHGSGSWLPVPSWYRALTAAWMPERLRVEFSLPYGEQEEIAALKAQKWLPRTYRRLPGVLRFVGPYQEARSRLMGRRAGPLTRASNRFWIGQAHMPSHPMKELPV